MICPIFTTFVQESKCRSDQEDNFTRPMIELARSRGETPFISTVRQRLFEYL